MIFTLKILETHLKFKPLGLRPRTDCIILHHSGTGRPGTNLMAQEIHNMHVDKGWSGIGYHYVIRRNGTIERGRPHLMIGAHCQGHNSHSLGIHLSGDFELEHPTQEQIAACIELCGTLCRTYKVQSKDIYGHRDRGPSACPGINLYKLIPDIRLKVHNWLSAK